jgi:septum formation protein
MESIILASESPRRRELLEAAGIPFEIVVSDIDESERDSLPPHERVLALAEDKARAAALKALSTSPRLVLAADTLVCLPAIDGGGEELALGKPDSLVDARRMLHLLAGRCHVVRTGLAVLDRFSGEHWTSRSDSTVFFSPMGEAEIEAYLASKDWEGVAGAYRIQGRAAYFIDRLDGTWSGVVGLPLRELYVILSGAGYRVPVSLVDGNA